MRRLIFLLVLLTAIAWAEFEWPAQMVPVKLNNQVITVSWRDGRPFAQRREVFMLLRIPREGDPDVDLAAELGRLKARITTKADGSIDAIVPKVIAGGLKPAGAQAAQFRQEFEEQKRAEAMAPRLVASGYRYTSGTGFIRAFVKIENLGGSTSKKCSAKCQFVDWYGKPFAVDKKEVPPLEPGESAEGTFYSVVERNESDPNQSSKYTCKITFE